MRVLASFLLLAALIPGVSLMGLAQSSAPETKPGTGVICGQVIIGGQGARGVTVMAMRKDLESRQNMQTLMEGGLAATFVRVKTDEEGKYRFSELVAAPYQVFAYAPSMVGLRSTKKAEPAKKTAPVNKPSVTRNDDEEEDDEAVANPAQLEGPQRYIDLAEGQTVENINFTLARGGVITGRVTFADGRPVIGQTIQVTELQPGETSPTYSLGLGRENFTTDDRGMYRVYGLPDGRYNVSLEVGSTSSLAGLSSQANLRRTYYPNATDVANATPVEVPAGSEVRGIDIKLGAAAKTFVVTGRVVETETGKPVPNVSVIFEHGSDGSEGNSTGFAQANAKGEFRFESVTTGSYRAYSLDGFLKQSDYYGEACRFEVKDGNVSGVVLKLRRGATISGVVVLEGAGDATAMARLAQQTISAISGGRMAMDDKNDNNDESSGPGISQSPIAPDGSFMLKGLKPGNIQIGMGEYLSGSNFAISRVERGGGILQGGLELRANENISDLRVFVAQKNCVIRGQVKVEGGSLPKNAGFQVTAQRLDQSYKEEVLSLEDLMSGGSTTADADGQFKLEGLIPGEYEVTITYVGKRDPDNDTSSPAIVKQTVLVTSDKEAEVTLVFSLKSKK